MEWITGWQYRKTRVELCQRIPTKSISGGKDMARRTFLAQLAGLPFLSLGMKAEQPCCEADSHLFMRSLLPGLWGHGNRLEPVRREIW